MVAEGVGEEDVDEEVGDGDAEPVAVGVGLCVTDGEDVGEFVGEVVAEGEPDGERDGVAGA